MVGFNEDYTPLWLMDIRRVVKLGTDMGNTRAMPCEMCQNVLIMTAVP